MALKSDTSVIRMLGWANDSWNKGQRISFDLERSLIDQNNLGPIIKSFEKANLGHGDGHVGRVYTFYSDDSSSNFEAFLYKKLFAKNRNKVNMRPSLAHFKK